MNDIDKPSVGQTYLKKTNEKVRMLVCDIKDGKVQFMEHNYPCGKELPIDMFLERFKLEIKE